MRLLSKRMLFWVLFWLIVIWWRLPLLDIRNLSNSFQKTLFSKVNGLTNIQLQHTGSFCSHKEIFCAKCEVTYLKIRNKVSVRSKNVFWFKRKFVILYNYYIRVKVDFQGQYIGIDEVTFPESDNNEGTLIIVF